MEKRNLSQNLLLSMKGIAMGAADVVPGVSGGTIAFITGIYEELIDSLNKISFAALKVLFKEGPVAFWKYVNGTFFLFLFVGILTSIFTLAKLVSFLLETYPIQIWSFFFGLIIASVWLVVKTIRKWNIGVALSLVVGIVVAFYIAQIQTVGQAQSNLYILLSGALAICAMILPGISGSFILVILGSYHIVLNGIREMDLVVLGLFATGCIIGLLAFSRILKFLFAHFRELLVALLTGFMIGSLYKVWPWKIDIGDAPVVVHSNGEEEWMTTNVLPGLYDGNPLVAQAILFALVGFVLIVGLELTAKKLKA